MKTFALPALLALLFCTSCSPRLSPLTQRIVEEQGWGSDEFQRIQFYLSEDLVLERELREGMTRISNGKVQIVNGREVERVFFAENTPGVYSFSPKSQRLAISFEADNENVLIFGPNPGQGGRYVLLAQDWNNRFGQVTYAGRTWRVSTADAAAALLIPLKRLRQQEVKGRTVSGRKL